MRISMSGLGYVGAVSAACLAADGHMVVGVDVAERPRAGQRIVDLVRVVDRRSDNDTAEMASAERARRVLIVVQNLPVPFDRRVWLEATTLAQAGYRVSVICPKAKGFNRSFEELEDVHIYRYGLPVDAQGALGFVAEFLWCFVRTAMKTIRVVVVGRGFDVLHVCNPPETYWPLALFWKRLGRRFLFDHHDLSPEMYQAKFGTKGRSLSLAGLRWLERKTFQAADLVITTNESHKRIAVERGGVPPGDAYVVRSGPDLERLSIYPPDPTWRKGKRHLIAYLGEICNQDGVDHLIRAVKLLRDKLGRDDIHCVLIGGGPHQPSIKAYADEIGVADRCTFTGRVSDEVLCRILSSADVGVDPDPKNDWSDKSTMNKVMEYQYFGLPVVGYDLTENRVSAGPAGLFATPNREAELADRIAELLDDPARRQEMGQVGQERVRSVLAWEHSAPVLLAAYDRLWPDGGPPVIEPERQPAGEKRSREPTPANSVVEVGRMSTSLDRAAEGREPARPRLSIAMPTRNRPELLERALGSVLEATAVVAGQVEVTVSDGSDDAASGQVVRRLLADWPGGYQYVHNRPALSLPGNINRAMQLATGEWILQLHDDDYLRPGAGKVILEAIHRAPAAERLLLFGVDIVDAEGVTHRRQRFRRERYLGPETALRRVLRNSSFVRMPAAVVHREAFEEEGWFDTTLGGACDTDMWVRLFARYGVRTLPATTCAYTTHQGAATAGMWNRGTIQVNREIFDRAVGRGLVPAGSIRRWESDFFHQFILAGAYRQLRLRRRAEARDVLRLFDLPEISRLGASRRWLPVRLALAAATAGARMRNDPNPR